MIVVCFVDSNWILMKMIRDSIIVYIVTNAIRWFFHWTNKRLEMFFVFKWKLIRVPIWIISLSLFSLFWCFLDVTILFFVICSVSSREKSLNEIKWFAFENKRKRFEALAQCFICQNVNMWINLILNWCSDRMCWNTNKIWPEKKTPFNFLLL